MSIITTAANYGGRVVDNQQGVKQFYISGPSIASWIYKKLNGGLLVQTPANSKIPVLINSDVIITGSIFNTSDQKLKDNITSIPRDHIDDIFTLNPILFTYRNDSMCKKHYGVLAQDVEKVFPNLVKEDITGFKTVNYQELLPLMLAKMKNMQEQIDEIKQNKI
jgi:hypothetical protein